jgi:DHA1 family bicyclomycin/chloramphenicol resistance-like MFS transporter
MVGVALGRWLRVGLAGNAALLFWAVFFLQAAFGTSDRFKALYIESLGAKPALVGVLLGIGEAIRLAFLIASGPLSDRISPRLLINCRWLAVANALVFLLAWRWWQLFPAFVFQATANLAWPSVSRVIDESGDETSRAHRFLMIYTIAASVPLLVMPLVGGALAEAFGLRSVFVVLTVGLIVSGGFFFRVRPTGRAIRTPHGGYLAVLRHRPTALLSGLAVAGLFSANLGLTLAANFLHNERGFSVGAIGAFGTLVAAGGIISGLAVSRVRRLGRSLNGTLLTFAVLPAVFALLLGGRTLGVVGAAYLCWGVASVAQQTFFGAVGEVTPAHLRTRAFASLEVAFSTGMMLAGFAAGALYSLNPALPLWLALAGSILIVGATFAVRRSVLAWQSGQVTAAQTASPTTV